MSSSLLLFILLFVCLRSIYADWRLCPRWHLATIVQMLIVMAVGAWAYRLDSLVLGELAVALYLAVRFADAWDLPEPVRGLSGDVGRYRAYLRAARAEANGGDREAARRLRARWLSPTLIAPLMQASLLLDCADLLVRAESYREAADCFDEALRGCSDPARLGPDWDDACLSRLRCAAELQEWDRLTQGLEQAAALLDVDPLQWTLTVTAIFALSGDRAGLDGWLNQHRAELEPVPFVEPYWRGRCWLRSLDETSEARRELAQAAQLATGLGNQRWARLAAGALELAPSPATAPAEVPALLGRAIAIQREATASRTIRLLPGAVATIAICLAAWSLEEWMGGSTNPAVLYRLGAATHSLFVFGGQWWRLITAIFLHAGMLHLAFNCAMIYFLGTRVESIYGTPRTLAIFLISGTVGNLLSMPFAQGQGVGASGSAMALLGAWGAAFVRAPEGLPRDLRRAQIRLIGSMVVAQTLFDQMVPFINGKAHLVGAGCGFLLGLALYSPAIKTKARREIRPRWLAMLAVVLLLPGLVAAWHNRPSQALVDRATEIYREDGRTALLDLLEAQRLNPTNQAAWFWLGYVEQHEGMQRASVNSETRALALYPEDAIARLVRANAEYLLELHDQAWADCQHALALEPERGDALGAYVAFCDGQYAESRRLTERVLQRKQDTRWAEMLLLRYFAVWRLTGQKDLKLLSVHEVAESPEVSLGYARIIEALRGQISAERALAQESPIYGPEVLSMRSRARIYLALARLLDGQREPFVAMLSPLIYDPTFQAFSRSDDLRPIALQMLQQIGGPVR